MNTALKSIQLQERYSLYTQWYHLNNHFHYPKLLQMKASNGSATLGKILTADNLRKSNIILVSWCCMCKANGETVNYLLLHCPLARELWDTVFALIGVQWVMRRRVIDLLVCRQDRFKRHRNNKDWRAIPHCLKCLVSLKGEKCLKF